jgi:hypothetical protein
MSGIYWLASYPKSGNTWFRSFLSNFQTNGDSPADINRLSTGSIASNRGWLDELLGFDTAELSADEIDFLRPAVYQWARHDTEVKYHKIHDAYTCTPDGEPLVSRDGTLGALYIIRNPLDVAPSAAHHWDLSLDETIGRMERHDMALAQGRKGLPDQVRQKLLTWSEHVLSWVDAPGLPCLTIRYEDMLSQPVETFAQAVQFLQLPQDAQRIENAIRFSSFKILSQQENEKGFKERPSNASRFFRQGQSGGWRETLTTAQADRIVTAHGKVMQRFGYLNAAGQPI